MSEKIKECPFCGKEPEWVKKALNDGHFYLRCNECRFEISDDRKDKVLFHWNKRQPPPVEVEQLAAIKFSIDDSMPEGMKYNQGAKREGFIEGFKAALTK